MYVRHYHIILLTTPIKKNKHGANECRIGYPENNEGILTRMEVTVDEVIRIHKRLHTSKPLHQRIATYIQIICEAKDHVE